MHYLAAWDNNCSRFRGRIKCFICWLITNKSQPKLHSKDSLSIRRFWGKGEGWKRKKERADPPPPSPISNLLSPSPLGRPDTQAIQKTPLFKGHLPWCRGGPLNRGSTVGKKSHLFGQTSCVKKIIYFRRKLSRSSAQQEEAEGWTISSTTDIFRNEIPIFQFGGSKYTRLQKNFFFKISFQERRRREILARNERAYFSGLSSQSHS